MWTAKKFTMTLRQTLARHPAEAVEIPHRRKRAPLGGNSGDVRGTGKPVLPAGARHRRAARRAGEAGKPTDLAQCREAGQPAAWCGTGKGRATGRPGAMRPGEAPSISYMEGALLYILRDSCPARTSPQAPAGTHNRGIILYRPHNSHPL